MKTSEIATLKTWITESNRIVFFGGAGVSTESGIPDFRSVDGLYHQKFDYPPETILSHSFFYSHTEEFYRFYREKMLPLEAEPNAAHLALATLEREGKLRAIVTQNIDGLHQKAGSPPWSHKHKPAVPKPSAALPAVLCHARRLSAEYPDKPSDSNSIFPALAPSKSATRKIRFLRWGTPQYCASRTLHARE